MTYLLVLGLVGTITGCFALFVLSRAFSVAHEFAEKHRKP